MLNIMLPCALEIQVAKLHQYQPIIKLSIDLGVNSNYV